jgi:drug/metabolite transporter (DMT)-like permease
MVMAWIAFGDRVLATDLIGLLIVAAGVLLSQKGDRPET